MASEKLCAGMQKLDLDRIVNYIRKIKGVVNKIKAISLSIIEWGTNTEDWEEFHMTFLSFL